MFLFRFWHHQLKKYILNEGKLEKNRKKNTKTQFSVANMKKVERKQVREQKKAIRTQKIIYLNNTKTELWKWREKSTQFFS